MRSRHDATVSTHGKERWLQSDMWLYRSCGSAVAFSDRVLAIVITIMVLELKAPEHLSVESLAQQLPSVLSYLLSFVMVGIVWVNHHHVFHLVERVDAGVLWLNNLLLLWVSLVPFATTLVGRNWDQRLAAAVYGAVMLGSAAAFALLRRVVAKGDRRNLNHVHRRAHMRNACGVFLYGAGIPLGFWHTWAAHCDLRDRRPNLLCARAPYRSSIAIGSLSVSARTA